MASDERRRRIEEASRILVRAEARRLGARATLHAWAQRHSAHLAELLEQAALKCRLKGVTSKEWAEALRQADLRESAATERDSPGFSSNVIPLWANISLRSIAPVAERPSWWRGAALVTLSILVCALGSFWLAHPTANVYSTGPDEMRRVRLVDGSVVKINSKSALHVRYTSGSRDVELLYGEALFTVAQDARRPSAYPAKTPSFKPLEPNSTYAAKKKAHSTYS